MMFRRFGAILGVWAAILGVSTAWPQALPFPGPGGVAGPPPPCTVSGAGNTVCTGAACTPALATGLSRYVFVSTGNLSCAGNKTVRYCVIAGGASGGTVASGQGGGGGGAGGMLIGTGATLVGGTVTIGAGGALVDGSISGAANGNPGQNTSVPITGVGPALGGGFGGSGVSGGPGGAGGGGFPSSATVGGTGSQGKNGGAGNSSTGFGNGGGGGGGGPAGTAGASAPSNAGAAGGNGDICPIDNVRYAGGGGGSPQGGAGTGGTGGLGGGGIGGDGFNVRNGGAGAPNTGSGGGAGGPDGTSITRSGQGGSGKAIIEELVPGGANTPSTSLLHLDGTNGSTTATDSGSTPSTWAFGTGASLSTAQWKFGPSSAYFTNATTATLSANGSAALQFGTGDFTVDFWIRQEVTESQANAFGWGTPNTQIWYITNVIHVWTNFAPAGDLIVGTTTWTINTWHHIAITRASGTIRMFLDGVQEGPSAVQTVSYGAAATEPQFGAFNNSTPFQGWIDEIRIIKGYAAWTANFTPPTSAYAQ